ncbi:hypothetical protein [Paraburkholderia acidipaludis]|uniref:hypothetical protein n=1 Tax=Paraburkholderia acidipaludis TaxID=660537 RepID=UPI00047F3F21|nr:hypothetical protein [Paraburkholderia acidipaludis]
METHVVLTPAHWVYLCGVAAVIIALVLRANVVAPAILATFATALAATGHVSTSIEAVFFAPLTAARELFNIFLVISLMTALLNALKRINADVRMVQPFRSVMVNGHVGFFVLALVSYVLSLFFWPTPSVPLIAGILLPAAIYSGVPPLGAAMCIGIAGLGTALSSDYILKVAPGISARAAAVAMPDVADKALLLSLITGGVALLIAYGLIRKQIGTPDVEHLERWEATQVTATSVIAGGPQHRARVRRGTPQHATPGLGGQSAGAASASSAPPSARDLLTPAQEWWSKCFAVLTPLAFLGIVVYMVLPHLIAGMQGASGNAAAALVGGVAGLLLLAVVVARDYRAVCKNVAEHITEGFVFSFRAMSSVLPIAGFFFIGVASTAAPILSLKAGVPAPGLLADLVRAGEVYIPHNTVFASYGIMLAGMITGIDGSGFAGLPLTGALSGALGRALGVDVSTLAAVGQMGSVWTGKTLTAWSALAAVASFARVPVLQVVRCLLIPVVAGLLISTLVAILVW